MYTDHFGLERKAFTNTPDPRFLWLNEAYEEALASLLYAVEEREPGLLIGHIGTGKSLLVRALLDRLDSRSDIVVITNPRLSPVQLLQTVAEELGVAQPSRRKGELTGQLQDRLLELDRAQRRAVLIIDEAQLIPRKAVFDELRLLTNFQLDDRNLITLLLVGQPELKRRLRHPAYRPLTQRLAVAFELRPLEQADTVGYVAHRLRVAGANGRELFTPEACLSLHQHARGGPRVINRLATQSLIEGFIHGACQVDAAAVERVASSMLFLS